MNLHILVAPVIPDPDTPGLHQETASIHCPDCLSKEVSIFVFMKTQVNPKDTNRA
jgi:hypothetical protein